MMNTDSIQLLKLCCDGPKSSDLHSYLRKFDNLQLESTLSIGKHERLNIDVEISKYLRNETLVSNK